MWEWAARVSRFGAGAGNEKSGGREAVGRGRRSGAGAGRSPAVQYGRSGRAFVTFE